MGRLFASLARRAVARLRREKLKLPVQAWGGPGLGEAHWKAPTFGAVMRMLPNPAYAYGQKEYAPYDRSPLSGKAKTKVRAVADWPVCVPDVYPACIPWEQFVANQQTLRDNWFRSTSRGAPRRGRRCSRGSAGAGHG